MSCQLEGWKGREQGPRETMLNSCQADQTIIQHQQYSQQQLAMDKHNTQRNKAWAVGRKQYCFNGFMALVIVKLTTKILTQTVQTYMYHDTDCTFCANSAKFLFSKSSRVSEMPTRSHNSVKGIHNSMSFHLHLHAIEGGNSPRCC